MAEAIWQVGPKSRRVHDAAGNLIAMVMPAATPAETEVRAQLIASAPQLQAQLDEARSSVDAWVYCHDDWQRQMTEIQAQLDAVTVEAKATRADWLRKVEEYADLRRRSMRALTGFRHLLAWQQARGIEDRAWKEVLRVACGELMVENSAGENDRLRAENARLTSERDAARAELEAARAALGLAWTKAMTLAEGIEAKTKALEDCITGPLPLPEHGCECVACLELRRRQCKGVREVPHAR